MPLFSLLIGDIPGDAAAINATASGVETTAQVMETNTQELEGIPGRIRAWEGEARESFDSAHQEIRKQALHVVDGIGQAGDALVGYGASVSALQRKADELHHQALTIDAQIDAAPPLAKLPTIVAVARQGNGLLSAYRSLLDQAQALGAECAALVREALHLEPVNRDESGSYISDRTALSDEELEDILRQLDDMGSLEMNQRGIGDCYFLSALIALNDSTEGREHLRNMIKPHYDENGKLDGYFVTIYDDPLHRDESRKRTEFVDDVYASGARGKDGKANVYSLFESAYGQMHQGGTMPGNNGGITGGWPGPATKELSGGDYHVIDKSNGFLFFKEGYKPWDQMEVRDALEADKPVTAETATTSGQFHPDRNTAVVHATDSSGRDINVELVGQHAYQVKSATADTVTIVNPWGHNYLEGGGTTPTGEITISWEDFGKYYGLIAVGDGYAK